MSGLRFLVGFAGWLALMLLAAAEELRTVAYVVDRAGFGELGSEWHWRNGDGENPFAAEKFVEPTRLEKTPNGSRFFADGDRMWLLTGTLRQQKVLKNERSWAVWNEDRNRLVVHGTAREHGFVAILWEDLNRVSLAETSLELVKVRCGELAGVAWTEEEVRKRGGQVVHVIGVTTRPGLRGSAVMGTEVGDVQLEVEAMMGHTGDLLDLRLNYEAAVRHPDGVRQLSANTGMAVFAGHTGYVEVGGADEAGETYLLGVRSFTKCLDGTPRWRWREFEDESILEKRPEKMPEYFEKTTLADGMILSRVWVPPTFLEDIRVEEDEGDPRDPDHRINVRKLAKEMGVAVVDSSVDVPGCLVTDLVLDLTDYMKKKVGLEAPKGGWIRYNVSRGVLLATLDVGTTDLLDALTMQIDGGPPRMIRGTVTLIEWEGVLEPGKIPAGARRLARMGMVVLPGQRAKMRHGWPAEELNRGGNLVLEANIGANNRIVDVRVDLEVEGRRSVRLATGVTVANGRSVVVPLGEDDGKKLGVVVECRIIDGTGREVGR